VGQHHLNYFLLPGVRHQTTGRSKHGMTSMVEARHLSKRVNTSEGELVILDDINLSISAAETVAIVGASGSGKSTLLGLMAGLDGASGGDMLLDGQNLSTMDEEQRAKLRGQSVGFVFQSFQLLPSLTALENVMLPIELKNDRNARQKAAQLLQRVGLEARVTHYPNQLSGGEQQRVAIARAFASQAKILFADEPTGNLDTTTGAKVIDLLFSLNKEYGTTLVLVTHDDRLARRCGRLIRLVAGEITEDVVAGVVAHD
jgi:putative ABC transport system ATP-binding protein